jgi:hypothetical protein
MAVHGGHPFADAFWAVLRYCADAVAYASVPIAIVLLIARPSAGSLLDMVWPADPDRRLVAVAFATTLCLPILPALLWGIEINAIWTMSAWTLLPVVLLSSPSVRMSRLQVRWIVRFAILFPLIMLPIAPAVAWVAFKRGLPPKLMQTRMLAKQVETAWHAVTSEPLRYVSGTADFAYGVATYAHDRPKALPGLQDRPRGLRRSGIALICAATDDACTKQSSQIANLNPASRKFQIELIRSYWGVFDQPQGYLVFTVPPSSDTKPP